eukprot:gnl/TRDRNA2_/TRDRNA2_159649_c0_seq1.p1 gnl/TRDRNA2_/TRDRNA2_159649_c0~~gnl/TRDRNA2_/TRDRNA2_159649_c0_seq1.p1  ORF type:complete len:147 (-),score=19.06 gnl/TRDRNA2_/TRDRNA2_159649_c0_seq1:299-739(-)
MVLSSKKSNAFPDRKMHYYNFHVDPFKPNRVFFVSHFMGTNTGKVANMLPATNARVESPPQAESLSFNERGEVSMYTTGYVMDHTVGNTFGLGGALGVLTALGYALPFPDTWPSQPSENFSSFSEGGYLVSDFGNMTLPKSLGLYQ